MGYRPGRKLRAPWRDRVSTQVGHWQNFSPLSLQPNLWLDASDLSTLTVASGRLSQWNDKSGNNINFSNATGAEQPYSGSRTINGLNVIDFIPNNVLGGGDNLDLGTNGLTIFSVVQFDATNIGRTLLGKYKATPRAGDWLQVVETGVMNSIYNDGTANRSASQAFTRTTALLYTTVLERVGGSISQRINNVSAGSASFTGDSGTSRDSASLLYMGALRGITEVNFFPGYWFDGAIAEIIICLRTMTEGEINTTTQYLNTKWGLVP